MTDKEVIVSNAHRSHRDRKGI